MIANYGYEDASGFYYVTIDDDACARCTDRPCVGACPQEVLEIQLSDYDDLVAVVREDSRRRLRELCAPCKTPLAAAGPEGPQVAASASETVPCVHACSFGALRHSW